MATPFDARLGELPEPERAEIDKLLAERPRDLWHSDEGDGLAFHLLAALAALGALVAGHVNDMFGELAEFWAAVPYSLMGFYPAPPGLSLAILMIPLIAWRFRVLHGRHGWMVTSFGYLRVRGPRLRLVRWRDITRLERRVIGSGRGKFSMLLLTTPAGTLECDTAIFFNEIKQRLPATATVQAP